MKLVALTPLPVGRYLEVRPQSDTNPLRQLAAPRFEHAIASESTALARSSGGLSKKKRTPESAHRSALLQYMEPRIHDGIIVPSIPRHA